jgi:hypothetical protein
VIVAGKKTLFLLLAGLAILAGLLFHFKGADAWRLWNIPVMSPSFADARSLLAGVEAQRLGYDPLYQNPLDPFGRVMAYPRLWLALGIFNLTQNDTTLLAAIELGLFLAGLFLFIDEFDGRTALLIAAFLISPAAVLCFERGNNDLIAFFLLACALAVTPLSKIFSISLIGLAAFLKLYPIFALGYLVREPKKSLIAWLSGGLAVFGAYVLLTGRDIQQILALAPKGVDYNYGVTVVGLWILDVTGSRPWANFVFILSYLFSYLLLVSLLYRVDRDGLELPAKNPRALDAFRVGALIYIGTFLQGNTWDYRLIFLIFSLPQLAEWAGQPGTARIAGFTVVCFMLSSWMMILAGRSGASLTPLSVTRFSVEALSSWGLLAGLTYLLLASTPPWIREEVHRFFEKFARPVTATGL